jgi:thiol-disulfide isomerase/thioredoxin
MNHFPLLAAVLAMATGTLPAFAATLNIGDPAPKLEVSKWVQGDPVTEFSSNNLYIVEFWATWCGPCRESIPHLNKTYLQFKDKNLIVIGVDIWEQETAKVEPFVKEMGSNMTYRVAMDSVAEGKNPQEGKMAVNWMAAAGGNGIPTAFLINKEGKIVWIGHPHDLTDDIIENALAGTFDIKKASEDRQKEQAKQLAIRQHSQDLVAALKAKSWDKASAEADELEKTLDDSQKPNLIPDRVKILFGRGDSDAAKKLASKTSEENKENISLQFRLATELATNEDVKEHDYDLANKIIQVAFEQTKGEQPQVMALMARIQFLQGNKDTAVELQSKAIEKAKGRYKEMLQKELESYKEGKLPGTK